MPTPVNFTPLALDFGVVVPGSAGPSPTPFAEVNMAGGVALDGAPAGAVNADISGPNSEFFTIGNMSTYRWVKQYVDPGELPGVPVGHPRPRPYTMALQFVAKWDGVNPLPVSAGEFVLVQVTYSTRTSSGGKFGIRRDAMIATGRNTATLNIRCDAWTPNPVQIPLSFLVGQIKASFDSLAVTIPQGSQGSVPISVRSIAGPSTTALFALNTGAGPASVYMDPASVVVPGGTTQHSSLTLKIGRAAPLGTFPLYIDVSAFGGEQPYATVTPQITLTISPGKTVVNFFNATPIVVSPNGATVVPVVVTVTMSPTDFVGVDLIPDNLPLGVTMAPLVTATLSDNPNGDPNLPPQDVDAFGSHVFNLTLVANLLAIPGTFPLTLNWSSVVGGGDSGVQPQSGSITTNFTVLDLAQNPRQPGGPRHAGFGTVVSLDQVLANSILKDVAATISPQTLNLPAISVGTDTVSISGSVQLLSPTLAFHERLDNLISVSLSLQASLTVVSSLTSSQELTVTLSTSLDLAVSASVINGNVFVAPDFSQASITELGVIFEGPPPASVFESVFASPGVLAAVTNLLRQLPLVMSPPLMSATVSQPIPLGVPPGVQNGTRSTFGPYPLRATLSLTLGTIVIKTFEGAITVAADFVGVTTGDPSQLVNLLATYSPLITYVSHDDPSGDVRSGATMGAVPSDAAMVVLVNSVVFANLLATQVSPAFDRGPFVNDHVLVHSVTVNMGLFDAGAPFGTGYGLAINADVSYYPDRSEDSNGYYWPADSVHVPAGVTIYAKMWGIDHAVEHIAPYWHLQVVNTSVSLPGWLPFVILIFGLEAAVLTPIFFALAAVLGALLDSTLASIEANVGTQVASVVGGKFSAADTPAVNTVSFLGITLTLEIFKMGFGSEGAEMQIK